MSLSIKQQSCMEVSGDLTLESVAELYRQSRELFPGEIRSVDLSGVSRIDSAGLALLLEWQSAARKLDTMLAFNDAPDDLISLSDLCEATDLLGLKPRAETAG